MSKRTATSEKKIFSLIKHVVSTLLLAEFSLAERDIHDSPGQSVDSTFPCTTMTRDLVLYKEKWVRKTFGVVWFGFWGLVNPYH